MRFRDVLRVLACGAVLTGSAFALADDDEGGLGTMIKGVNPKLLPPPPPPPVAQKGDMQLDGLYHAQRMSFFNGRMNLEHVHYYFFPDGHFYNGLPPGGTIKPNATKEDMAAMEKAGEKPLGVYQVKGRQITFQYAGSKPETHGFSLEKPGNRDVIMIDGLGTIKVGQFKDRQTLDAKYEGGSFVAFSTNGSFKNNSYASNSNTLDFHPDGTFGRFNASSFSTQGRVSETSGGGTSSDGGKYTLGGNTLTMTHNDGKTESLTVYPFPEKDENPPAHISVSGTMFKLEKR